jgi:TPR repeat protein
MKPIELDSLFQRADRQLEAGNLRSAFRLFLWGAKAGDTSCQVNLGNLYADGTGVKPSRERALYWYRRAYRRGETCAASNIGVVFRDEGNFKRALAWFERAAELKDGDANLEIAKIYLARNDKTKAIHYLRETRKAESVTEASEEEAEKLLKQFGVKYGRRRRRSWR